MGYERPKIAYGKKYFFDKLNVNVSWDMNLENMKKFICLWNMKSDRSEGLNILREEKLFCVIFRVHTFK